MLVHFGCKQLVHSGRESLVYYRLFTDNQNRSHPYAARQGLVRFVY